MAAKKGSKAKGKKVSRVLMNEDQAEKFLKKYLHERDLKGKEAERAIRHCAATRWAALERDRVKREKK